MSENFWDNNTSIDKEWLLNPVYSCDCMHFALFQTTKPPCICFWIALRKLCNERISKWRDAQKAGGFWPKRPSDYDGGK